MKKELDEDINWGKLFLKVILIFIIVIFVFWLLSKLILSKTSKVDSEDQFNDNLNQMYDVAYEYFEDESKLPNDGKRSVLTLKEMYDKDLIDTLKVGRNNCSTKEKSSYAKVSNKEGKYTLTVLLTCGSQSDYISEVIKDTSVNEEKEDTSNKETNNSSDNTNTNKNNTNTNTNTSNNTNNGSNSTTQETEKVVVTDYTTMEYKFCKIGNEEYYTVIYVNSNDIKVGSEITYTIKLDNLKNVSKVNVNDDNYFLYRTYFNKYKKNLDNNFTIINGMSAKDLAGSTNNFIRTSLKSSHFDYILTDVYEKDGSYYVDVEITIKKLNSNSDIYNGTNINYIPVYFSVSYANLDNCVTDTYKNSYKYDDYYVIK